MFWQKIRMFQQDYSSVLKMAFDKSSSFAIKYGSLNQKNGSIYWKFH